MSDTNYIIISMHFIYMYIFRFKSAMITDKRVKVMNEVVLGMRLIKMYAWELAFKKVVTALRRYTRTYVHARIISIKLIIVQCVCSVHIVDTVEQTQLAQR